MAPLEINAAGRPVVAYGAGGATETVIEGMNGVLFREQTAESLIEALEEFENQELGSSQPFGGTRSSTTSTYFRNASSVF